MVNLPEQMVFLGQDSVGLDFVDLEARFERGVVRERENKERRGEGRRRGVIFVYNPQLRLFLFCAYLVPDQRKVSFKKANKHK
jgi:hypothetical protein